MGRITYPWFKNFRKRQKIGKSDLSFSEYFKEIQELQDEQANCISVHSVYSPALISQTVQGSCAKFYGLARRSQKDQILSCFLGGEWFFKWPAGLQSPFGKGSHTLRWRAKQTGTRFKFSELFDALCNATRSKIQLELGLHSQKIFFMEDIVKDPNSLAIELKLIDEKHPPLTIHKKVSHKGKQKSLNFLVMQTLCSKLWST